MAQFKEDSLEQVYKCRQRGGVRTKKSLVYAFYA